MRLSISSRVHSSGVSSNLSHKLFSDLLILLRHRKTGFLILLSHALVPLLALSCNFICLELCLGSLLESPFSRPLRRQKRIGFTFSLIEFAISFSLLLLETSIELAKLIGGFGV